MPVEEQNALGVIRERFGFTGLQVYWLTGYELIAGTYGIASLFFFVCEYLARCNNHVFVYGVGRMCVRKIYLG